MSAETQPPAPAVVAVVVTCDPGPWFEQTLTSLAEQDYPNLSVLIVDAASLDDPTPRVAGVLPAAYVRRLDERVGFGRAVNEVLSVVEGASHYVVCHDDVALDPGAIRLLVEEAFRSNAGIASPKFVQWEHPERLLSVGAGADKVGVVHGLMEPGELDQEQYDAVRDLLVAPSGVALVRADLFQALRGYDPAVEQFGEDLDLSWRAHLLGARVVVVPAARVRHLEAMQRGMRPGSGSAGARRRASRLNEAHRAWTITTCYRWFDLAWILPLAVLFLCGEAVARLLQGRPGDAYHTFASFFSGYRRPGDLWAARRRIQRRRRVGDAEIRRLQSRGNARLRASLRAAVEDVRGGLPPVPLSRALRPSRAKAEAAAEAEVVENAGRVGLSRKLTAVVGLAVLMVLLFGSRGLIGHDLPAVGLLPNLSGGWGALWRSWWSTWQPAGLGVAAPSTPALALLGTADTVLLGASGVLQHVVVLGALVIGPIGAYRAARWWGSQRGRIAALVTYAVVPVGYDALARGHWPGLVAYAVAPWLLSMIGRLSGEIPFPATGATRVVGRTIGLGLLVAVGASVAPSMLVIVPLVGVALLAGSALVGRPAQGVRMLAVSASSAAIGFVVLLPWSATVVGSGVAMLGVDPGSEGRLGFGQVLRFDTGPIGHGPLGWAVLVVAALPLLIGRDWRLAWGARLWAVAIAFFWLTWAGSRGWIPALPPEVALAPAAAALAGSAALGAVAFELDLPGYRFGWRQLVAGVSAVALALAAVPMLSAASGGRWNLPNADANSVLTFLPGGQSGAYRVAWVGAPDALPLAGRQLQPGVAYATSYNGVPDVDYLWTPGSPGATNVLGLDLHLVEQRLTTKLGHLLAPMGIRYLVVPAANAPFGSGGVPETVPADLTAGLGLQTDLQLLDVDPNYTVYENAAWAPARSILAPEAVPVASLGGADANRALQETDLSPSTPALTATGGASGASGPVAGGGVLFEGSTRDGSWTLHAGGAHVSPSAAFGWAMSFAVPAGATGTATVAYRPPLTSRALQILELVLVFVAAAIASADLRRRRTEDPSPEVVRPEWFTPTVPSGSRRRKRRFGDGGIGAADLEGEEVWIDA